MTEPVESRIAGYLSHTRKGSPDKIRFKETHGAFARNVARPISSCLNMQICQPPIKQLRLLIAIIHDGYHDTVIRYVRNEDTVVTESIMYSV